METGWREGIKEGKISATSGRDREKRRKTRREERKAEDEEWGMK